MFEAISGKIQYVKSSLNEHSHALIKDVFFNAISKHHDRFSQSTAMKNLGLLSFSYALIKHKKFLQSDIFRNFLYDYFHEEFNFKPKAIEEALDLYCIDSHALTPVDDQSCLNYDFLEKSFIEIYLAKDEESIIEELGLGPKLVKLIGSFFCNVDQSTHDLQDGNIINAKCYSILKSVYNDLCSNSSLIETKKLYYILNDNSLKQVQLNNIDLENILESLYTIGRQKTIHTTELEESLKLNKDSSVEKNSTFLVNLLLKSNIIFSAAITSNKTSSYELSNVGYELTAKRFAKDFASQENIPYQSLLQHHSFYQSSAITLLANKKPTDLIEWLQTSRKHLSPAILRSAVESLCKTEQSGAMVSLCKSIIYDQNLNIRLRSVATRAIFDLAPSNESALIYHTIHKANLSEKIRFLANDFLRKIEYLSTVS